MHEQDPQTFVVCAPDQRSPVRHKTLVPDEHPADDDMKQLHMSIVGAMAWLIMTMPAICIYVAFLQRKHSRRRLDTFVVPTAS